MKQAKKTMGILAAILMAFSIIGIAPLSASAEKPAAEELALQATALSNGEVMVEEDVLSVSYVKRSWDDENDKLVEETAVANEAVPVPADGSMTSGWYYLDSNVTKNGRIESITGDVNLILGDGFTLDVKGLYVPEGSTLTIYGQSEGTGKIYSHPSSGAGIGGYSGHNNGNIVINGGTVDAKGYDHCAGIGTNDGKTGGKIEIYGGTVTAKGGEDGAGIGGGRKCSDGDIVIYGGTVTAKGGEDGAAIGGGASSDGGFIRIFGGDITANGPTDSDCCENGAGIGGGDRGTAGNINIYGGTITAYSRDGAGIGGGDDGGGDFDVTAGSISIYGGTITSIKVNQGQGARIGGGCDGNPSTITIEGGSITTIGGKGAGIGGGKKNKAGGSVTINGGVIESSGSYGIGSGEKGDSVSITLDYKNATKDSISITSSSFNGYVTMKRSFRNDKGNYGANKSYNLGSLAGSALVSWDGTGGGVDYIDPSKGPATHTGEYSTFNGGFTELALSSGWYVISGKTTVKNEISVRGNINLVLEDGCTLSAPNIKVPSDSKLTIWGQSGDTGAIVVKADHETKAGIGGANCDCGTITINGGVIEATGGSRKDGSYGSAGIGGSYDHKPGTVIINGGTVTATGGKPAAGIGGGAWVNNRDISTGKVEIRGGTVTATGKNGGAGIGSGLVYSWLNTKVMFGTGRDGVNATGTVTISGGTVNAYGSEHPDSHTGSLSTEMGRGTGAAIGGGALSTAGNITISGGEVNAYAVKGGAAIGTGGFDGASYWTQQGGSIKISGGTVNAVGYEGGGDGAAIGGGFACCPAQIDISGGNVTATGGCCGIGRGLYCVPQCTTYLSWSDSTKDTMSITASSFGEKLVMKSDFVDSADGTAFPPANPVKDLSRLAGKTLVPAASQTKFSITIGESIPEGVLTTNYQSALPDTKITITVHDKEGFKWNDILVIDKDFNIVKKMSAKEVKFWDNTGFFFMPYSDVTIEMDIYGHNIEGDHYSIDTLGDAPVINSSNMEDVVGATLTQEELEEGYSLLLVSSPLAEDKMVSSDKAALENQVENLGATSGVLFDISLYKVLDDDHIKLSESGTPVKLTVEVPASLQKDGRTFYLLSCHDGKASVLGEGTGATLECEMDKFSTCMIAYKDNSTGNSSSTNSSSSSSATSPKTGDSTPVIFLAALALAAGALLLLAVKKRREQ